MYKDLRRALRPHIFCSCIFFFSAAIYIINVICIKTCGGRFGHTSSAAAYCFASAYCGHTPTSTHTQQDEDARYIAG